MKKVVLAGISVVLLIACLIMCGVGNGVRVGAGFGFGDSIEEPEDLVKLIGFVTGGKTRNLSASSSSGDMFQNLASFDDFDDEDDDEKYTSATIEIESSLSSSSRREIQTSDMSTTINTYSTELTRKMQVYITEDGTFYRSKGRVRSANNDRVSISLFDVDIYKTDDGDVYFYFRELSLADYTESIQIKNEYKNKWIELPEEVASMLSGVDSQNMSSLSTIGDYISVLIDTGEFDNTDSIRIDENDITSISEKHGLSFFGLGDSKVDFRVDLSTADAPSVYLGVYASGESPSDNSSKSTDMITFLNINNTVVSFDKSDIDVKASEIDDADDIFLIHENEEVKYDKY